MKRRSLLIAGLAAFFSLTAGAKQKLVLSIDDAIRIGLQNSKALHSSQFKLDAAAAKASETNTLALPSLKFNGVYTRLSEVPPEAVDLPANSFAPGFPPTDLSLTLSPTILDNYSLRATLAQPLFTGKKISGAIEAADYSARATEQDLRKDKADITYGIQEAYWVLYQAIEAKRFVDENVDQVRIHETDADNLLRQGLLTKNDLMKVQVQMSDALVRQIDAEDAVQLAMYSLNNTLGLPLQTQIELSSAIRVNDRSWDAVDSLIKSAMDRRPEVLGMDARVKAGEAGLESARGSWWPQIYLVGNYSYLNPNTRYFPVVEQFKGTWDLSVSLSYDIWNWWQTGYQTAQAQAQLAQAQEGLSIVRDGVTLEVTQCYLSIEKAKERKAVSEQGVAQAEENYRIMTGKYKQGLAVNSDLRDAEVELLQAKLNLTQSLVNYQLAIARLTRAIGE
ncbi:MAG TPA: TolC family protein [Bacteroidota bacterium]|nr:TolC family protein [Bacteroidota bacterium]